MGRSKEPNEGQKESDRNGMRLTECGYRRSPMIMVMMMMLDYDDA